MNKLNKISKKMSKINSEYSKLRKLFFDKHPMCQAKIYKCSLKSTDIHHTYSGANRHIYFLEVNTWLSVCRNCHTWIHNNPDDAKELGLLK